METQEEVIQYLNRPEPFDLCEQCPQPPREVKWKSLMPEQDKKTVQKAIENIDIIVESLS